MIPFLPQIRSRFRLSAGIRQIFFPKAFKVALSRLSIMAGLMLFMLWVPSLSMAASFDLDLTNDPSLPWRINADEISFDENSGDYIAKGHVIIHKGNKALSADHVRFNYETLDAEAKGDVILKSGADVVSGARIDINLETETGTIYDGYLFLKKNNFHINGSRIEKIGPATYTVVDGSFTSCGGNDPDWKISAKKIKITLEGYGYVTNAALWAKSVPVAYLPFFAFPAKQKRQSGLLYPQFGYSDRKGIEYIQPFFWAISENVDATFYSHFMDKRGEKVGLEFRYALTDLSKGALMFDFLNDSRIDEGSPSSRKWGYNDIFINDAGEAQDPTRENRDRYWFRMTHHQELPRGFFGRLDLDIVSDQDYLREFRKSYTGFDDTEGYFSKYFGRELDDYNDPTRLNRLNINKNWSQYSFNAAAKWWDDVISRRLKNTDMTLQRLPVIDFDASRRRIGSTPLYSDLKSEYTYFYSEDNSKGHRIDVFPRFYLPMRFRNYLAFEPSVGLRGTAWYVDRFKDESSSDPSTVSDPDKNQYRGLYDLKLDLSTDLYKTYQSRIFGIDGIKHLIRPQVIYNYVPDVDQDEHPRFDNIDRIAKKNVVTYQFINTFTSRSQLGTVAGSDLPQFVYNRAARFKLSQSYDIAAKNDNDPEPFSPIFLDLDIYPGRYFAVDADASWSVYDNTFETHNIALNLWDDRGDIFLVEHRYRRETAATVARQSVYSHMILRFPYRVSPYLEYERDIENNENVKTGLGVLYQANCWSVDFSYSHEENDDRFTTWINLYGLGGLGKRSGFGPRQNMPFDRGGPNMPSDRLQMVSYAMDRTHPNSDMVDTDSDELRVVSESQTKASINPPRILENSSSSPVPETDLSMQQSIPHTQESARELPKRNLELARSKPEKNSVLALSQPAPPELPLQEVPVGNLVKRIAVIGFQNATPLSKVQVDAIFQDDLIATIRQECPRSYCAASAEEGLPPDSNHLPRMPSGKIDNASLNSLARKEGISAVVTGTVLDIRTENETRGILWFKNEHPVLHLSLLMEVYDTTTGAKIVDDHFQNTVDLDQLDYEAIRNHKFDQVPMLRAALKHLATQMGETVCTAFKDRPWSGFITTTTGGKILLSSGKKVGIRQGNLFNVFADREISGNEGHQFVLPGSQIGVIKVTAVDDHTAEAMLISGTLPAAGATIRPLE